MKPLISPTKNPISIAVFVSGSGTNLESIYKEQKRLEKSGDTNYGRADIVFTNVPKCRGEERARSLGIPVVSLGSKDYFEILNKGVDDDSVRDYYDAATITLIENICKPDLIVLAGYRRRLGSLFLNRYKNRVINLYPGDVTKPYLIRGVDASIQALRAGEGSIRCTVFLARENERFGPAMLQSQPISLEGYSEKDKDEIEKRIREEGEWIIYPFAIHNLIAKGRVGIDENDNVYIDGKRMNKSGYQFSR
jgi:phosphoribosylglycinamide formyltransferase-1